MTALYEILVPTVRRVNGKPYRTRFHRVWDGKVRNISGGLTVLPPTKGQWVSPQGELFAERMIPVRFVAETDEQVEAVCRMTLQYYDQLAVMCYRVSDHVIIMHAEETKP